MAPSAPPPASSAARPFEWLLPAIVTVVSGGWMLLRRQGFLVDDAYISFRYAENLARGHGLVWNAGEPVEGYTNLLWVLMLAPFARLGVDLAAPALLASAGFALGCLWLLGRLSRRLRPGRSAVEHMTPALLLASVPSFAHAATSGMEGPGFAFWTLLGLDLMLRGRSEPRLRVASAICLALAYFTRPEGAMVAALLLAFEAWHLPGPLLPRLRALAPAAAIVGSLVSLHVAARLAYYGHPLPNTFYAKVIWGPASVWRGVAHLLGFLLAGGWLALPGASEARSEGAAGPWWRAGYALAAVYAAYLVVVGGDHPFWYRFHVPLLPLPLLALCERASRRAERSRGEGLLARLGPAAWSAAQVGAPVALAALVWCTSLPFSEPVASVFASVDARLKRSVSETDRFFRDEVPKQSLVAAAAVGYFGYRNPDLFILDVWGLNDAHIAHLDLPATVKFGHDKTDLAYIASRKPDYLLLPSPGQAPALPGYDLCSPERFAPALVYRRNTPLDASEMGLGLAPGRLRPAALPPPCPLAADARPPG